MASIQVLANVTVRYKILEGENFGKMIMIMIKILVKAQPVYQIST